VERDTVRIFFDSSALIAGLASPKGGAGAILDLCEAGLLQAVMSRQVLVEVGRTIQAKFPALVQQVRAFMRSLSPELVEDPSRTEIEQATKIIIAHDAPTLAAALKAKPDYLITLNTKHFCTFLVRKTVPFKVLTPAEFWKEWRQKIL